MVVFFYGNVEAKVVVTVRMREEERKMKSLCEEEDINVVFDFELKQNIVVSEKETRVSVA